MEKEDQFAFQKYEPAWVAHQYAEAGQIDRAHIALLATPVDNDGTVLLKGDPHYSTPEGIKSGSMLYGNEFKKGLAELTFAQLKDFYKQPLSGLSDKVRKETETLFDKYSIEKLGEIETAYTDAVRILKDPEAYKREISPYVEAGKLDEIVKEKLKGAEKTKEEYEKLIQVRQLLQEKRNASIERSIGESLLEKTLKS